MCACVEILSEVLVFIRSQTTIIVSSNNIDENEDELNRMQETQ